MGPSPELVAAGETVTVVVVSRIAGVQGVGEGPLAGIWKRPLVEVASGLLLEAVLDSVAIGVLAAGIGLDRSLDGVGQQVAVVVRPVPASGGGAASQGGYDHRRVAPLAERAVLAPHEDAQTEACRAAEALGVAVAEQALH